MSIASNHIEIVHALLNHHRQIYGAPTKHMQQNTYNFGLSSSLPDSLICSLNRSSIRIMQFLVLAPGSNSNSHCVEDSLCCLEVDARVSDTYSVLQISSNLLVAFVDMRFNHHPDLNIKAKNQHSNDAYSGQCALHALDG